MKKYFLSLVFILFSVCYLQAIEIGLLSYSISNGKATVTGVSSSADLSKGLSLEIPSTIRINGMEYPVVGIGKKAFYQEYITEVSMPDSPDFTSIGDEAFGSTTIRTVVIPKYVTKLGQDLFKYCSVTTLRINCGSMNASGESVIDWSTIFPKVEHLYVDSLDIIPSHFLTSKTSSTIEIYVKEGCTLKSNAFFGLSHITIIGHPKIIEKDAFGNIFNNCEVNIDLSKTSDIRDEAFCKCKFISYNSVIDLTGCDKMGTDILKGCYFGAVNVRVNGNRVSENYTCYTKGLSSADITSVEVEYSSSEDFTKNRNLTSLFPKAAIFHFLGDKVSKYALYGCKTAKKVEIDGKEIEENAFAYCTQLNNIRAKYLRTMTSAFVGCTGLTYVEFPEVDSLGGNNFRGCTNLESCSFPKLLTMYGYEFYNDKNLKKIYASKLQTVGDYSFYNCANLEDGYFNGIANIGNFAFYGCSNLTDSEYLLGTLPGNPNSKLVQNFAKNIGDSAFVNTGITSVFVGYAINTIGLGAFSNLKKVTINSPSLLEQEVSILNLIGLRNDGTAKLNVGDVNLTNSYEMKCQFNPAKRLKLDSVYIGNGIGKIYSKGFYNIEANNVHIGWRADFVCPVQDIQLLCKNVLTIDSYKIFVNNNEKKFSTNYNLTSIFGKEVKEINAIAAVRKDNFYLLPEVSDYAFYINAGSDSELTTVSGPWSKIGKRAFDGNKKLSSFTFTKEDAPDNEWSIGALAFRNCNLPYYSSKNEIYIGECAFQNNPMKVIEITNEKAHVEKDAFLGTDPHMVIDLTDGFIVDNNKETVKFITNSENRAKELRAVPYSIVHACSIKRLSHTAEDVNLDGSLSGDDVQLIYNAMK